MKRKCTTIAAIVLGSLLLVALCAGVALAAVQEAAKGPMQRVVEYSEAPLVSSDIIGNTHSSIFDALSTNSQEDGYARIVSWYDNEWGYSNRVVDLIGMLAAIS